MRVALCLFGHIGGVKVNDGSIDSSKVDIVTPYEAYKKSLIDCYDVDVFIHSWSIDQENAIVELYKPKGYMIEPQRDFQDVDLSNYSLSHLGTYTDLFLAYKEKTIDVVKEEVIRTSSRWYSNCKSIELLSNHVAQTGMYYDFVIQSRLDLVLYSKINFESLKKEYIYCPTRGRDKGLAVDDLFFISNYENCKSFSSIFKKRFNYSIRAPFAAKQHMNFMNVNTIDLFKRGVDFELLRDVRTEEDPTIIRKIINFILRRVGKPFLRIKK